MTIMVKDGALPERGDKVMVDFGYPIGPFATADLSGLDIGYDSRQRRAAQIPNYRKMPIADAIGSGRRPGPADFATRRATAPATPIPTWRA
jgi:3-hydroxyacyl-CoA dehydrogenase